VKARSSSVQMGDGREQSAYQMAHASGATGRPSKRWRGRSRRFAVTVTMDCPSLLSAGPWRSTWRAGWRCASRVCGLARTTTIPGTLTLRMGRGPAGARVTPAATATRPRRRCPRHGVDSGRASRRGVASSKTAAQAERTSVQGTWLLFPVGTLDHGTSKQHAVGEGASCPVAHSTRQAQEWRSHGPHGRKPLAPHRTGANPAACGGLQPVSVRIVVIRGWA
jgi:hypothetical protein